MKTYTKKQIKSAIKYWKTILENLENNKELNEVDSKNISIDELKNQAKTTPVDTFDLSNRLYRTHNAACAQTEKVIGSYLQKQKLGDPDSIIIENSCVTNKGTFKIDEPEMFITINIMIDKMHLKNWKKFLTKFLSETDDVLNEDFWKNLFSPSKRTENVKNAEEKLKSTIGVHALQTYVLTLCGKSVASKINRKNIFFRCDDIEKTEDPQLTYMCYIKLDTNLNG